MVKMSNSPLLRMMFFYGNSLKSITDADLGLLHDIILTFRTQI